MCLTSTTLEKYFLLSGIFNQERVISFRGCDFFDYMFRVCDVVPQNPPLLALGLVLFLLVPALTYIAARTRNSTLALALGLLLLAWETSLLRCVLHSRMFHVTTRSKPGNQ